MRLLKDYLNELSQEPSRYKDYCDYHEHGFKEHLKQYFIVRECDGKPSIVNLNPVGDFKPCLQEAIWFCATNYFNVLKARVIGHKFGRLLMNRYLQERGVPEYDCSKGPLSYPLEEFGLLITKEGCPEIFDMFVNCLKENVMYQWEDISIWLRFRHKCRGMAQLGEFFESCVMHVEHPEVSLGLDEKNFEISDLFVHHD